MNSATHCLAISQLLSSARKLQVLRYAAPIVCTAALLLTNAAEQAQAVFEIAGDLAVDLRENDLNPNSTSWLNHSISANSVGAFNTRAGNVNVGNIAGFNGLFVNNTGANSLVSALPAPITLLGTSTSSTEAWVYYPPIFEADETIVAWGVNNNSGTAYRGHRYAAPGSFGSGMFSSWFQDENWDEPEDLIADAWVHVAWVYDSGTLKGYVNGVLETTATSNPALNTLVSGITIGARNTGSTADAFKGYIASVRVHTGILSDAAVLHNFLEGIEAEGPVKLCDFNGDNDCDSGDFVTLRDNLFTNGTNGDGDMNGDGFIDLKDFRLFKDSDDRVFGLIGPSGSGGLSQVPEPTVFGYLVVTSLFLLPARRFRKKVN